MQVSNRDRGGGGGGGDIISSIEGEELCRNIHQNKANLRSFGEPKTM